MFISIGFKTVTMDDIAQEMGMSKKTVYQYYPNKNKLVEDVAFKMVDEVGCTIDSICESGFNAVEEIFEVRNFLMKVLSNAGSAPIFQLKKFYPRIALMLKSRQFKKMQYCVKENLEKGIAEGLYRPDINVEFVSRIYFTGMAGIKDGEIFPPEMFDPKDITCMFLEYHMRAIVTPKGLEIVNRHLE